MKKIFTLVALLFFSASLANAQADRTVKGRVTAEDEPNGLPGVSVSIKGTTVGTITDLDGNYSLSLPAGPQVLVYSFIGYISQEVEIVNQTSFDIVLMLDVAKLDEVVVIGYGVQQKKVATGAISKITTENIEGFNTANVQGTLDGQVSGLVVNQSSGQPGAGTNIFIRGISTNGDNSPLFIVDGLQVSGIDNINPTDIESVDVLKDAASSAIYGARAANGVVIITTKKGSKEDKGEITYEGFTSVSNPWKLPEMLNAEQYVTLTREKFANANQLGNLNGLGFPQAGAQSTNTSWMDQVFDQASTQTHRLSAVGKNSYMSLEYWDQNGVVGGEKSNYKRYSARLNSTKEINDFLTIGENIYINRVENQNIGTNNAFGGVIIDAFAYDPITGVYDDSKDFGFAQSNWVQKEYINPLSRLFITNNSGHSDQIVGNVYLEAKPIEGLTLRSDVGVDYSWFNFRNSTPVYDFHSAAQNPVNDVGQGYGYFETLQFENYANYKKEFGEHSLDLVVGTTYRTTRSEQAGGSSSGIPLSEQLNPNWQYLDSGIDSLDLTYGGAGVKEALISYYGRAIYNYKGKYLFSATVRRDGSSKFGANNRWGVFPSFSAGWVISDEDFFNVGPINFMKLRTSWGVNGSDRIGNLAFASRVENSFSYAFGVNPILLTGAALATPPNPNIKWEESVQFDIGLEMGLFNDKVTTEIDVYQKTTKDLLMQENIPGYVGATNNPTSNLGEIQNTGLEFSVAYRTEIAGVNINTRLNYTTFKNEVINVAGDAGFLNGWSWPVRNTPITRMAEGFPVGHFVGYQTAGIFQSDAEVFSHLNSEGDLLQPRAQAGDLRFVDINGDGVINSDDVTDIGDPWADHIIGLTINADYKGFDFSVIFAAQLGHDIFRSYERSDVTFTNYQTIWLDRWTPENPSSTMPRLVSTDPNNNQRPSDFYIQDGSFLRLRNLQIGYSIPTSILEKVKLKKARVYISANNLLTITGYDGFDPEIGTNGWVLDTGIDKGYYPSNRTIGAGIRVSM